MPGLAGAALRTDTNDKTRLNRGDRSRLFPLLMGLCVASGLSVEFLVSPFRTIPFPLFALMFAAPIGTLRVREGRLTWLGTRYAVVCCVSALATSLPFVVTGVLNPIMTFGFALHPSLADAPVFIVFIALEGALSAWFAVLLQRWADRESLAVARTRSHWDPRSWGIVGNVGGSLVLLGTSGLAWIAAVYPYRFLPGPSSIGYSIIVLAMGVLALIGLGGLVAEAGRGRISWR